MAQVIDLKEDNDSCNFREERDGKSSVYRYNFSKDICDMIIRFSKLHEYDTKNDFKEAWEKWYDDNYKIISNEFDRLSQLGYRGKIKDKMYRASRYYFRKKEICKEKKAQKRRNYIKMSSDIITAMDIHIENNCMKEDYSPAKGYKDFCDANQEDIMMEIKNMIDNNEIDCETISDKFKKTYKNRYFLQR